MTTRRPLPPLNEDGAARSEANADEVPWDLEGRFGRLMEALDEVAGHANAPAAERGALTDAPLDPELQARLESSVRAFLDETRSTTWAPTSAEALEAAVGPLFESLFATAAGWARERPELLGQKAANGANLTVDVRAILDEDDDAEEDEEEEDDATQPDKDAPRR